MGDERCPAFFRLRHCCHSGKERRTKVRTRPQDNVDAVGRISHILRIEVACKQPGLPEGIAAGAQHGKPHQGVRPAGSATDIGHQRERQKCTRL